MKKTLCFLLPIFFVISFENNKSIALFSKSDTQISPISNSFCKKDVSQSIEYLYSYSDVEFYDDEYMSNFKCKKELNVGDYKYCEFDSLYIKQTDLIFFDLNYFDSNNNFIKQSKTYAYPFINDNNEVDIRLDYYGRAFFFSKCVGERKGICPQKKMLSPEIVLPPPVYDPVYDVLYISSCLTQFNDVQGIAYNNITIPDLETSGPFSYLFYQFKLELARSDFNNNISKTQPTGYIHGQNIINNNFDEWRFGLDSLGFSANISSAGCGCIAIYNMLYDCDRPSNVNPHLPSIIALAQLCNADLLGGVFGILSYPNEVLNLVTLAFENLYETALLPLISTLVAGLASHIFETYTLASVFVNLFFPNLLDFAIPTILAAITTGIALAQTFLTWFLSQQHDLGDVIELVIGAHTCDSFINPYFSSLVGDLSNKRQGIISYWNNVDSNGNIVFLDKMHIVYVRYDALFNTYCFYNLNTLSSSDPILSSVASGIEYYSDYSGYASNQFATGFVMVQ